LGRPTSTGTLTSFTSSGTNTQERTDPRTNHGGRYSGRGCCSGGGDRNSKTSNRTKRLADFIRYVVRVSAAGFDGIGDGLDFATRGEFCIFIEQGSGAQCGHLTRLNEPRAKTFSEVTQHACLGFGHGGVLGSLTIEKRLAFLLPVLERLSICRPRLLIGETYKLGYRRTPWRFYLERRPVFEGERMYRHVLFSINFNTSYVIFG
jgi:hypothetical protein